MISSDIVDAIGKTPLVEVARMSPKKDVRLFVKLEGNNPAGSVKDRIAKYMIAKAEESGELTHDKTILEATSGNTGIALALIGRRSGYRVKVVMPDNVGPERRRLLEMFGAEIVFSEGKKGTNGAIEVAEDMAKDDRYFMPNQFANAANPLAHYETTGVEIAEALPKVDVFVAGIGTGGTLMGVGRRLKERNPATKVVGVEPKVGELVHGLRSLEGGFIPPILDLAMLNEKLIADSATAYEYARDLIQKEGIFCGVSAGAVIWGAITMAKQMESGTVVALLADAGWKYMSTPLVEPVSP